MASDSRSYYEQKVGKLSEEIAGLQGVCRMGSLLRGISFLLAGFLFFAAFFNYMGLGIGWWIAFGLSAFVFLTIVVVHQAFEDRRAEKRRWQEFYQQGLARLDRDWENLNTEEAWVGANRQEDANDLFQFVGMEERTLGDLERAAIVDLDLEGPRSLWRLLNLASTQVGQELLSRWMLHPQPLNEIRSRQKTVTEFSEAEQWRHRFLMDCADSIQKDTSPATVARWAVGPGLPPWLRALIQVARLNAALMILFLLLWATGVMAADRVGAAIVVLVGANFLISVVSAGNVHEVFRKAGSRTRDVVRYQRLLQDVDQAPSGGEHCDRLRQELHGVDGQQDYDYRVGMRQLVGYSQLSNIRSGMTFLLYVVLQFGFLWDLHVLERLESWRQRWGSRVPYWFYTLGYFEASAALAQLKFDHPTWSFPELVPVEEARQSACVISGTEVGHPLLGSDAVKNDVHLGCAQKTLLITGSNMSGKSTYLRTIGINLILGRMGAVVFAQRLTMPPVELGSSMRVADSLADGVSFFMSELQRLKQVVDRAAMRKDDQEVVFVYLLDEILQGTNSRERQIAVTRVIQQLLNRRAVGGLSTHDLQLPEVKELDGKLQIVHFRESFEEVDGREQMVFDYLLRQGMTPTTNALKLLALVGLDQDH